MQIPGSPTNDNKPQLPAVSPTYIAMAAARMHTEGRWPTDQEFASAPKPAPRNDIAPRARRPPPDSGSY